ncbi:NUMOD4 motif-containing HNH endonuclease [Microbacterium sp. NPDC028030]|uniref:NUMOD4 motif-containing HNH endonuclease n=1 Tax=Microbacterium sp. NPDC028030 TaxID=3155124 RepID=UPI0033C2DF68
MDETWKPVVGHEARYEVSNMGRVRSLGWRGRDSLGRERDYEPKLMNPTKGSHGYPAVDLRSASGRSARLVHHLVLEAFVGPRPAGMEACHGNGNRGDARLVNLRWDTHSANMADSISHGTHAATRRTHCPHGHPLAEPNLVASEMRAGRRRCLACARARTYARDHRCEVTQQLREQKYRAISAQTN